MAIMSLCQPNVSAVFLRWQFAHRTSHFSISFCRVLRETIPRLHISEIFLVLFPWWSNSKSIGSPSPQSTQGFCNRYCQTQFMFRTLARSECCLIAFLRSGSESYLSLSAALRQSLHAESFPSLFFFLFWKESRLLTSLHRVHIFIAELYHII